ncbi:hypothetical protein CLAIMM_05279 isoform 2 [Cladophialophora immunda]|nr:hypothetical protein CLAIMM_05279 isoform 1 [Cladophialophora immunda]OQU99679.1 hypothetical protein CLAIMM_05279 isoform 2 [Cladophialophora immunda]
MPESDMQNSFSQRQTRIAGAHAGPRGNAPAEGDAEAALPVRMRPWLEPSEILHFPRCLHLAMWFFRPTETPKRSQLLMAPHRKGPQCRPPIYPVSPKWLISHGQIMANGRVRPCKTWISGINGGSPRLLVPLDSISIGFSADDQLLVLSEEVLPPTTRHSTRHNLLHASEFGRVARQGLPVGGQLLVDLCSQYRLILQETNQCVK